MKLWLPHDPGQPLEPAAKRELVDIASRAYGSYPPRGDAGLAVRFRFLHKLEPGLATLPSFPAEPPLLDLAQLWAAALEGVLWRSTSQIAQVYLRREWAHAAGLEVSL